MNYGEETVKLEKKEHVVETGVHQKTIFPPKRNLNNMELKQNPVRVLILYIHHRLLKQAFAFPLEEYNKITINLLNPPPPPPSPPAAGGHRHLPPKHHSIWHGFFFFFFGRGEGGTVVVLKRCERILFIYF